MRIGFCSVRWRRRYVPPISPTPARRGSTFHAWNTFTGGFGHLADYISSYGKNGWVANPSGSSWYYGADTTDNAWHREEVPEKPTHVPLLLDSAWLHTLPLQSDAPPPFDDHIEPGGFGNNIRLHCMDRHLGAINGMFLDGHARRVGLKELWTLKWQPQFNTENRWTSRRRCVGQ
jgi:prepilin-type processing-associated H-X9-DG protein